MSTKPDTAQAAFDCVLRAWAAHEAELKGYLARQTADVDTADDLLQEVFLKAIRQGRDFCTLDNARAWLFQVARNALVDLARAKRPHAELGGARRGRRARRLPAAHPADAGRGRPRHRAGLRP